jgi:MarR family transcriptional regulator, lower aerobic nicotinate degradation pathway regulator
VKLIDQLESLGQVARRPDAADRRRHILSLTAAGERALRAAGQVIDRVTDEVFAGLTAEERQTLHRLALRALGEPTGDAGSGPAAG